MDRPEPRHLTLVPQEPTFAERNADALAELMYDLTVGVAQFRLEHHL